MMFFDKYPEFVERDLRKNRGTTQVTSESLSKRCEVLLPEWLIKGKRVLDLGHCIGAMGQWSLTNGSTHYTGVDIQKDFCDVSTELLSKHWTTEQFTIINRDVVEFMKSEVDRGVTYDVILASGIIHGYMDTVGFIELMTKLSSKYIVVESIDIPEPDYPVIEFKRYNMVSQKDGYPYSGWTPIVGFNALRSIMNEFGFTMHGERIYPRKIIETHDSYNDSLVLKVDTPHVGKPNRYMIRYCKSKTVKYSLNSNIVNDVQTYTPSYNNPQNITIVKSKVWEFDDSVAKRFQQEAETNIPDYERVLDMCLAIAKRKLPDNATIIDVGSALGHTMDKFIKAGFRDTFGVDYSESMIENSLYSDKVKLSSTWPKDFRANFVMANWTLHFINERQQYIQDIYNSLEEDGVLIISDKTPQSDDIKELYYDFKRNNGVTDEYIYEKEQKLKGYMNLLPVEWYLDSLKEVGFKNIQIINSRLGFVTFYAEK